MYSSHYETFTIDMQTAAQSTCLLVYKAPPYYILLFKLCKLHFFNRHFIFVIILKVTFFYILQVDNYVEKLCSSQFKD